MAAAVRRFTATNGRTPTFPETCGLMGWSAEEGHRYLSAARQTLSPPKPPPGPTPTSTRRTPRTPVLPTGTDPAAPALSAASAEGVPVGAIPVPPLEQTSRREAWHWLVAHGQTPTEAAVTARIGAVRQSKAARARRRDKNRGIATATQEAISGDGPRARGWIGDYRAAHGQGPLWRELGEAMGWDRLGWAQRNRIITALAHSGHLRFQDGTERSLDTGPDITTRHDTSSQQETG